MSTWSRHLALAESGFHLPVNIAPDEFTLLELANGDRHDGLASRSCTRRSIDDPQVRRPDISLARELLGWEPAVELREGLRRTLDDSGVEALEQAPPAPEG